MIATTELEQPQPFIVVQSACDDIANYLNSFNYRNPNELARAADAIRWMFGESSADRQLTFAECCEVHGTNSFRVRKMLLLSFRREWTIDSITDMTNELGELMNRIPVLRS